MPHGIANAPTREEEEEEDYKGGGEGRGGEGGGGGEKGGTRISVSEMSFLFSSLSPSLRAFNSKAKCEGEQKNLEDKREGKEREGK